MVFHPKGGSQIFKTSKQIKTIYKLQIAPHPPDMPANVCWRSCSLFSLAVAVRTYELVPVPNWSRWAGPKIREQKRRPNPKKPKKPKRLRNTSAKTPAKPKKTKKTKDFNEIRLSRANAAFR